MGRVSKRREAGPRRVLLAAGEPLQLRRAADALRSRGCEVVEAGSGTELLEALWLEPGFDLIISAAQLPGGTGLQVLAGLREGAGAGLTDAPFVVVAGPNDRGAHVEGARLGATVVDGPLNFDSLLGQASVLTRRAA